jgi:predicted ATPase
MSQHPFLKSIRPVNLLSFGPNTEEIELRPLNILIGPNGSGKSNLIEVLGLLSKLPDKDPWSRIRETGGASEWVWKGKDEVGKPPSIAVTTIPERLSVFSDREGDKSLFYSIGLWAGSGTFAVMTERFQEIENGEDGMRFNQNAYVRDGGEEARETISDFLNPANVSSAQNPKLPLSRSVLSMIGNIPNVASKYPHISGFADDLERIAIYNDWVFGSGSNIRKLQRSGFESNRLVGDSINLAQVLKAMRDRGDQTVFESLIELMRKFYEPVKDVDTELLGTDLRIMIKEDGLSSRTPAERVSDGTLRWLMLLIVLLDPAPPPVICIEEPELGIHPDMLPTLADLLVEASARTQLIVTTHSRSLIDSFSENPDAVCICEKVQGSTVIERLDRVRLKVWLDKYSLGRLWTSGEIGGNRW